MRINDVRKNSHSISDHSDVESQIELEYNPIPKLWREIEDRKQVKTNMDEKSMMVDL